MNNQTPNDAIVKFMDRGLIVVPKLMRDEWGWEKNSYVRIVRTDDGLILKSIESRNLVNSGGYLWKGLEIIPAKKYTREEKLEILERAKGIWVENDYMAWKKMKARSRKRAKKMANWEPYW